MRILFFDTETNGKPLRYGAPMTEVDNWPRITQLAYIVTDGNGNVIHSFSELVKPDGWTIPKEQFFIDNGHSTERCEKEGKPIIDVLMRFIHQLSSVDLMVAHNMAFDKNIVGAEMIRANVRPENKPSQFCTMLASTPICKIPAPRGGYKWPKLEELYRFCFGEEMTNAHDAMADIDATRQCFFYLLKSGKIQVP